MRRSIWMCALGALVGLSIGVRAQTPQSEFTNNFKYNSGQGVQPVFEGWSRVPDGSFNMHFGYLNRNWVQEPHVPVGPANSIEPGGPDRGQPTYFYARTQRNLFTINVPKDWGKTRELTWTITVNGRTEKAVAWMQPEWEIDPVGGAASGGNTDAEYVKNTPPSLTIASVAPVRLPATATLTVSVTDDGLPIIRGRAKAPVGQETPPTLQGGIEPPVNVPAVAARASAETPPGATPGGSAAPRGLGVTWIVWRGPADAAFSPRFSPVENGKTTTTAKFSQPGTYQLRATANDTSKVAHRLVEVTVTGSAPTP
jgi:hypothetical protein